MAIEFITARFPENAMPRTSNARTARTRVRKFIPPGVEARIREIGSGEPYGRWRPEGEVVDRLRVRMVAMDNGEKLVVQRANDMEQLSIRKVETLFIPDLHAAPMIELLSAEIVDRFSMDVLRDGGLYVCRFIDGTNDVSHHGFVDDDGEWKGAARDWFVKTGGMSKLEEVYRFSVERIKAHDWNGAHAIVNKRIYEHPTGERFYTGATHFHLHNDVPQGVPCR